MRGTLARILCFALVMLSLPVAHASGAPLEPKNDPFYVAPSGIDVLAPGTILRTRTVDISLYSLPLTGVNYTAYQLLYKTNDVNENAVANVTTVIVPATAPPVGDRVMISMQDPEDALDTDCAPSYQLQVGESAPSGQKDNNLAASLSFLVPEMLAGRIIVIPDPEGPSSGYIVRLADAHAVLDSIRAAENFAPAGLNVHTQVGLFGYSGGAFETAAANELQPEYAPELNIVAATAGGVPVGNTANFRYIDGTLTTGFLMAVVEAIDNAYPEIGFYNALNAAGKDLYKKVQTGCASSAFAAPLAHFDDWTIEKNFIAEPRVRQVIAVNTLGNGHPTAPTFYYNGINDEIVWIEPLDMLVDDYCAAGSDIVYVRDPAGAEHIQGAANYAPMAIAFMESRFAGSPVQSTCGLPNNSI
jgi:Secretory lipase